MTKEMTFILMDLTLQIFSIKQSDSSVDNVNFKDNVSPVCSKI